MCKIHSAAITEAGLLVGAVVRRTGQPGAHESVRIKLAIDTGAGNTVLRRSVSEQLNILDSDKKGYLLTTIHDEPTPMPSYDVLLELPDCDFSTEIEVVEHGHDKQPFGPGVDGVLGRDILRLAMLDYDGPRREFTLRFPRPSED